MDAMFLAAAIRDRVSAFVDDVEVMVERADRAGYTSENGPWIPVLEGEVWRIAMRGLSGGRLTAASSTVPDVQACADSLVRALGCALPTPLKAFAEVAPVRDDRRAYDPALAALIEDPRPIRAMAETMRSRGREAKGGLVVESLDVVLSVSRQQRVLLTKAGAAENWSTGLSASVQMNGDWWEEGAWTSLPPPGTVEGLIANLVTRLPARELGPAEWMGKERETPVVLDPGLLESFLRKLWIERVGRDRALAGNKVFASGERVADSSVTVWDDPGARGSFAGAPTDDEGVTTKRKTIVENGIFTSPLSDRRSAAVAGDSALATGNGFRVPFIAEDRAEAPVRVAMGHLEMSAGDNALSSMVKGKAIWVPVMLGIHSANKATGAFNGPVVGGLALEDGQPVGRLRPGGWSLVGNAFQVLTGLVAVSRERKHTGSAELPWVASVLRAG